MILSPTQAAAVDVLRRALAVAGTPELRVHVNTTGFAPTVFVSEEPLGCDKREVYATGAAFKEAYGLREPASFADAPELPEPAKNVTEQVLDPVAAVAAPRTLSSIEAAQRTPRACLLTEAEALAFAKTVQYAKAYRTVEISMPALSCVARWRAYSLWQIEVLSPSYREAYRDFSEFRAAYGIEARA
jgi:hypothetical protein